MPAKRYHVHLSSDERAELEQMLRRGKHSTRKLSRARILLKAAQGLRDEAIATAVGVSLPTVGRIRQRFSETRLQALVERPRPGKQRRLDERAEARLIAEACTPAPGGRERWTLELLAGRVVELQLAETCSKDTVWRALKKMNSSRG